MHAGRMALRAAAVLVVMLFTTTGVAAPATAAPGNGNGNGNGAAMGNNGGGGNGNGNAAAPADAGNNGNGNGNGHGGAGAGDADTADAAPVMAAAVAPAPEPSGSEEKATRTTGRDTSGADERPGKAKGHAKKADRKSSSVHTRPETGDKDVKPQPNSNADLNNTGANDPCYEGDKHAYCSTRDGRESTNGRGDGKAKGRPCAGCVGKADNKYPPGQARNGSDRNAGYECDRNQGIGSKNGNPAHTSCQGDTSEPDCPTGKDCSPTEPGCPEGKDCDDGDEPKCKGGDCSPTEPGCPEGKDCDDGDDPKCKGGDCSPTEPGCPEGKDCFTDGDCVGDDCAPTGDSKCPGGDRNGAAPGCDTTPACPEGDFNGMRPGCEPATTVECPAGDMNGADEPGCTSDEPTLDGSGPPAFTDQERGPNRPPAEVAPSAGFLPDTGAGAFGLVLLAGMILMLAGGTLIALKRPRAAH